VKIAIVVHGRFHAFDVARELLRRGHEVTVFTNYPGWAAEWFGVPGERVRSFAIHGLLSRAVSRLPKLQRRSEAWLHSMFGRWACGALAEGHWDIIHPWSGIAEETLGAWAGNPTSCLLMRGSSHIRAQARLLAEEEQRAHVPQDRPSPWMIAREEREYALADAIVVPSTFAYESFVRESVPREKLRLLQLGVSRADFRPSTRTVEARCQRILAGGPLRILFVGALSFRKGILDLLAIASRLKGANFEFRLVGPRPAEVARITATLRTVATVLPKQAQADLPETYAWGDVFVFPTIEDGYPIVLAQAAAGGLPILTTTNCSGPDIIREGETGWVLPVRDPEAFVQRLLWCDGHRVELAGMTRRIHEELQQRDWADVAAEFEAICEERVSTRTMRGHRDGR